METLAGPCSLAGLRGGHYARKSAYRGRTINRGRSVGSSSTPTTFGLGDQPAAPATEVTARERRSMITRDKKSRYW
ncbi:hypothetical protein GCM10010510_07140 [Streptomyces anandii JCM 4720]|nr:hypothetical protein GCM10010510_07140 [Streptomyces anandii JCM 4720]